MKLPDLLEQSGIPYLTEGHEHCRPGWVQMDCPFCAKNAGRYRMGYNLSGGYLNCWACGHHSIVSVLVELGWKWDQAKRLLTDLELDTQREITSLRGTLKMPTSMTPLMKPHIKYLINRGFTKPQKLEKLWGLSATSIHASLPWRIVIPIIFQGETVSWTSRSINDDVRLRWISAPQESEVLSVKRLLYGMDYCRHCCVVHEGPTDVWRIGPGAVGLCGTGYSRAQVLRISRFPVRAICFDSSPDAQERARLLCDELEAFPGETHYVELDAEDPGSASKKEVRKLRRAFLA